MAQQPGLGRHHQRPLPLVQMWEQHLKLQSELVADGLGGAHITSTSRRAGINTLILCEPYYDLVCDCGGDVTSGVADGMI